MAQPRWWQAARLNAGNIWPSKKQARQVFLGSDIVLSGELTCCDTLVAEGKVESNRIECRHFVLGNAGSFKGVVQAESAVISGQFEGRLIIRERLLIRSGGQVRGSAQYGQIEIEPGGELQGALLVYPAKHPAKDGLDLLAIAAEPNSERPGPTGSSVSPAHKLPVALPNGANGQLNGLTDKPAA
jgi:cytoskeletal protein CcmA (bactofilin family)